MTQVQLHHCNVKVEQRTGSAITQSTPVNSFQIMGHEMSLNYSRNNMWLFMDVLEVFSEVRVVASCIEGCPALIEGTVELDPMAWGWWPQHLISSWFTTQGPSCFGVSQMGLLYIPFCPSSAAPLGLLSGVFSVAFVAHCKTGVGCGGWRDGPPVDIWQWAWRAARSLFHFTMDTHA